MLGNAAEWTASSYTPPARTGVKKKAEGQIPYTDISGFVVSMARNERPTGADQHGPSGSSHLAVALPPYSVVRGGSWNDTAALTSLPSRWRYMPFQGVQDVGFRVIVQP